MAQIFAVWHGGSSYSGGFLEDSLEMFNSVEEAVDACESRLTSGHWKPQTFDYLNRDSEDVTTPCVDETSLMDVYLADPTNSDDPYPDARIEFNYDTEIFESMSV